MKERFYFWTGDEVVVTERKLEVLRFHVNQLCVHTGYSPNVPEARYGRFDWEITWRAVPLEEFPKKFRVHLLLLGVV